MGLLRRDGQDVGLWTERLWQLSKSQQGCRWALQMKSWEIAPPAEVSAGGGGTLHVPGLFLQLSVSPTASVCFEAALIQSMFVGSKTPCRHTEQRCKMRDA